MLFIFENIKLYNIMTKKEVEFKSVVAETLLIPLYMRAKESRRGEGAILEDSMAESLVESIKYDYSKFDNAPMSEVGCVIRGWYFDNAVSKFIESHRNPIVVNVGCGLDTRYQRIGDLGNAKFYAMDLPEVIELRKRLIPEPKNECYIAVSILETEWLDFLKEKHPNGNFIFVIEGVIMYFYEDQVKEILHNIATRFSGGELWFDVCGVMMYNKGLKPDSMNKVEANIRSGINKGSAIEIWEPHLRLIRQDNYMKFFRSRWGFLFGQILGRIPWLCYKFSSLLGYKIN